MNSFFRILSFARPLGMYLPLYLACTLIYVFFSMLNIGLLIPILDVLFGNVDTAALAGDGLREFSFDINYLKGEFYYYLDQIIQDSGKAMALNILIAIVVVSSLISNLFRYFSSLILAQMRINAVTNLRKTIYSNMTQMHIGYFTNERKGDLMSRLTNDIQQLEGTVVDSFKAIFLDPLLIIGYLILLLTISPKLIIYVLLLIPLSAFLLSELIKRLKRKAVTAQESVSRITTMVDDTLSGMRLIKAFLARTFMVKRFNEELHHYGRIGMSMARKNDATGPVSEFFGILIVGVLLYIGGNEVLRDDGGISGSAFIAFIIAFARMAQPAKSISTAVSNIQRGLVAGSRVFDVIDAKPQIVNRPDAKELSSFEREIRFEQVEFRYEKEPVLKGVSFQMKKGEMVALVGPSGGGKSTIADLLARFYDPDQGDITLDGTSIRDYTIQSFRSKMGIVTQESILFNDTIFNNIAFGNEEATLEQVREAARIAHADGFIMETPEQYDTVIGDQGSKLSGGQRQRISIARAVLKNPDILILDEATSALDAASEKLVQQALEQLMEGRTSLVIAHRLSTIKKADNILVIEKGNVVESGTHQSLLASKGLYHQLSLMQTTQ